jgi:hypothetical protein
MKPGSPLEFQILEGDREAAWQMQEALEELRRRLSARPAADPVRQAFVKRLVRLNNNWPRLAQELRDLLSRRDTLKEFLALAQQSVARTGLCRPLMEKRLSQAVAHVLKPLADTFAEDRGFFGSWPEFRAAAQGNGGAPSGLTLPEYPPHRILPGPQRLAGPGRDSPYTKGRGAQKMVRGPGEATGPRF